MDNIFKASVALAVLATSGAPFAQSRNFELGVQAMMDKAGTTDIYLTAKPLDTLDAPTSLKQVQLKSFDHAGTLRWTKNLSDVPATGNPALAKLSYTDMQNRQPVQAQVLIQTMETVKTQVYKEKIPVLLRPDLKVMSANAPAKTKVGELVNISAIINEVNGDLGAKDVKVVLKNGTTLLDTVNGLAVNKGSASTGVFTHKFATAGTYR